MRPLLPGGPRAAARLSMLAAALAAPASSRPAGARVGFAPATAPDGSGLGLGLVVQF